jgi:DNA processing protein
MQNTQETIAWLRLTRTPSITVNHLTRILRYYTITELNELTADSLELLGLTAKQIQQFLTVEPSHIDADLAWLEQKNHHLITYTDTRYPELLQKIAQPPIALFVIGDPKLLAHPQLAMVGSRNPSHFGKETAFEFARELTRSGLAITSGLALGIDAASHEGALAGDGFTIAVCGTGLDQVYPTRHQELAQRILSNGALISEFPLGTNPLPENFPRRNRIISGLSLGTLVVEAALQSGSLITARTALEAGREVFAIPGSIQNPLARGCHSLIRQGAKLVETTKDVFEEIYPALHDILAKNTYFTPVRFPNSHTIQPDYQTLLSALDFQPTSVDVLVERTGFPAAKVASMLMMLELQSLVIFEPGGYTKR